MPGPWGRYGELRRGILEAAPGLSIGSVMHTEPIARFSGYMMNAETNADLVALMRNALLALLRVVERMRAEHRGCDLPMCVGCAALAELEKPV
jgi:hypothetical protein